MNCCQDNEFPSSFNGLFNHLIASEETINIREEINSMYFLNCCCESVDQAHPTKAYVSKTVKTKRQAQIILCQFPSSNTSNKPEDYIQKGLSDDIPIALPT